LATRAGGGQVKNRLFVDNLSYQPRLRMRRPLWTGDTFETLARRQLCLLLGAAAAAALVGPFGGCAMFGKSDKGDLESAVARDGEEVFGASLIGDLTRPFGMTYLKVESVSLVNGLPNTGSDPPPSPELQMLKSEMLANRVDKPNQVLASPTTSLVLVRGFLPPGVRKGDRFDVEVRTPPRSETTSLTGGWMMPARLTEMQVLGNSVHKGHFIARAEGPVLVDEVFAEPERPGDSDEKRGERAVLATRGRVLGGGEARVDRALGLSITSDSHSVKLSRAIGAAINQRFHDYNNGIKKGVAEPKRDDFIELRPLKLYSRNISRYMRVVGAIAVNESPRERVERLARLEDQLLDPLSAPVAALRLEAIGKEAVETLKKGLKSDSRQVRFYAAEALAYLDVKDAAPHLAEAAEHEPALRWHALAGLAVMNDLAAYDALNALLHVGSIEARYGAFWSLRVRYETDPLVRGERLAEDFWYHVIPSKGAPMIHVTRTRRPEIVLFGEEQRLVAPGVLSAGRNIMLRGTEDGQVKISRFAAGESDREVVVSTRVDDVVRGIVKAGGGYADAIAALSEAYDKKYLATRIVIDASPRPGRFYRAGGPDDVDALDASPDEYYEGDEPPRELAELAEIEFDGDKSDDSSGDNSSGDNSDGDVFDGEVRGASFVDSSGGDAGRRRREEGPIAKAHNPLPEVFQRRSSEGEEKKIGWSKSRDTEIDSEAPPKPSFFGRMKSWFK
jgi:flagellar basal body P-ring protein FlgI